MSMKIEEMIWDELGVEGASEEEKAVILNRLAETVQNRVALRMSSLLTAEQLDTFDLTLERKGADEAMDYLEEAYPNFPVVIVEEIEKLKAELSQDVAEVMHRAKTEEAE